MQDLRSISTTLAAALLLHDGEITLMDIEALPFVENSETARAIAATLAQFFDVERLQRRHVKKGISYWEDILRLKGPVMHTRKLSEKVAPREGRH